MAAVMVSIPSRNPNKPDNSDNNPHSVNITDDDVDNREPTVAPTFAPPTLAPSTQTPTTSFCDDGQKDQDETDVDCGGSVCNPCDDGKMCSKNSDCKSNDCTLSTCGETITSSPTITPTSQPSECHPVLVVAVNNFVTSHSIIWVHNNENTWNINDAMTSSAFFWTKKEVNVPGDKFNLALPKGTYGVMLIDDENNNGRLDTNWLGIPNEGVGASRGASGGPFGGPKWDDAKFDLMDCDNALVVPLTLWKE